MKRLIAALLLLTVSVAAQQVKFDLEAKGLVRQRLSAYIGKDADREATLKRFFQDAGCPRLSEQPIKGLRLPNLICIMPGETSQIILVGAHYDHVDAGDGVLDNWSGASLLPTLYDSLARVPRRHTFVFVAFSGEERGMIGSRFYVRQIAAEDRPRLQAMVNMDTLGLSPTKVWASRANPALLSALVRVANATKLPLAAVNVDNVGSTDSEAFRAKNVPSITIHSVTQDTWRFLHSPEDKPSNLKFDDYYDTYHLIAAYLAYLDQALPPPAPPPVTQAAQP